MKSLLTRSLAFVVVALLPFGGCSPSTQPRDPYAGTYDAILWTRSIHGFEPETLLNVEGSSYVLSLYDDGQATRRIIVPGGLNGGLYDVTLSGTWTRRPPDSLVVVLNTVTTDGDTVPVYTLPGSVQDDTLRTEWFGTNQYHEVAVLVER